MGGLFASLDGKYVTIDLSACTATTIYIGWTILRQNADKLVGIILPQSLTTIGTFAFYGTGLTSLTIPSSVTTISEVAFIECPNLTSITVDPSNTAYRSIDGVLFNKAGTRLIVYPGSKTGAYIIPSSVTEIVYNAFQQSGITDVTIPAGVTSIERYSFAFCRSLTTVTFAAGGSGISSFTDSAFPEGTDGAPGDALKTAYLADGGGAGTYTREPGGSVWTKQ